MESILGNSIQLPPLKCKLLYDEGSMNMLIHEKNKINDSQVLMMRMETDLLEIIDNANKNKINTLKNILYSFLPFISINLTMNMKTPRYNHYLVLFH